jgi:hypothetical protein
VSALSSAFATPSTLRLPSDDPMTGGEGGSFINPGPALQGLLEAKCEQRKGTILQKVCLILLDSRVSTHVTGDLVS